MDDHKHIWDVDEELQVEDTAYEPWAGGYRILGYTMIRRYSCECGERMEEEAQDYGPDAYKWRVV